MALSLTPPPSMAAAGPIALCTARFAVPYPISQVDRQAGGNSTSGSKTSPRSNVPPRAMALGGIPEGALDSQRAVQPARRIRAKVRHDEEPRPP